ncbi:MAG: hypothetical protein QOI63_1130 [Thermoplasmata archaeon]|jgi:uncharacterized protein YbjT (DUF2867 family)|nr:hypothetical protein [Thermoplasmata archaeon]
MTPQPQGRARQPKTFLVTGVTGQQGSHVAKELLARGHHVRGTTRNPSSDKAKPLQAAGAELVAGDFDRPDSIAKAARGTDGAFVMGTPFEKGPETETKEGIAAIKAIVAAAVPHVLYSSVSDADRATGIPHFESKRRVEEFLQGQDVGHTIVAPVFFRENLLSPMMGARLPQGFLDFALPGDRELQTVELREIGRFNAMVLERPADFAGRRINIASDASTPRDMAAAIETASGHHVRHHETPLAEVRKMSDDFARMMEWFNEVGYSADIEALRRDSPEVGWRSFQQWATDQDWSAAPAPATRERPAAGRQEAVTRPPRA